MNLEILGLILFVLGYNLIRSIFSGKHLTTAYCGLIGFSGTGKYNLDKIKFLMYWNSVERGKDATGVFTPESGIIKKAETAGKFFSEGNDRILEPSNLFIGHVRAKTIGANNENNAHPFKKENITLAHNGTLTSYVMLGNSYNLKYTEYDVDSQVITEAVFQNSFDTKYDNIKNLKILTEYEGAAALLFHNEFTPELLYVYRDSERTLYKGYDEDGNMYISSLDTTLKALDLVAVELFEQNTLYTIQNGIISSEEKYKTKRVVADEIAEKLKLEKANKPKEECKVIYLKNLLNESQRGLRNGYKDNENFQNCWVRINAFYMYTAIRELQGYKMLPNKNESDWVLISDKSFVNIQYSSLIKDDIENKYYYIPNHWLDLENFLPKKGDFVFAMTDIIARKTNQKLWSYGDVIEVLEVDLTKKKITAKFDKNKEFSLPFNFFRTMTLAETAKSKELGEDEVSIIDTINSFPNDDPDPFKSLSSNDKENDDDNDDNCNNDNTNSEEVYLVDYDVHIAILDSVNNQLQFIEERYASPDLDITPQINEIKNILKSGMCKDYLELAKDLKDK